MLPIPHVHSAIDAPSFHYLRGSQGRDGQLNAPVERLGRWLAEAREAGVEAPMAMTLVTANADGRPSARIVSLKRIEDERLVFTTALWTRKVEELRANPCVAATFFWPDLGRQVR